MLSLATKIVLNIYAQARTNNMLRHIKVCGTARALATVFVWLHYAKEKDNEIVREQLRCSTTLPSNRRFMRIM
jgi:hypothetical protein